MGQLPHGVGLTMDPSHLFEVRPTNRRSAKRALAQIYDQQGHPAPEIRWAASPHQASSLVLDYFAENRHELEDVAIERLRDSTGPVCLCPHCRGVGIRGGPEEPAWMMKSEAGFGWERMALGRLSRVLGGEERMRSDLPTSPRHRCAFSDQWLGGERSLERRQQCTWWDLAVAAGGWWLFLEVAVLFDRPVELHIDEDLRPDREDGPAIVYSDGWSVNARDGIHLPSEYFDPDGITADGIIAERNLERRRLLLERFGHERFVTTGGATLFHEDGAGQLWHIGQERAWGRDARGREFLPENAFVRVIDATPGVDGIRRVYWLSVPPTAVTAREAVAWTFGLTEEEYQPEVET